MKNFRKHKQGWCRGERLSFKTLKTGDSNVGVDICQGNYLLIDLFGEMSVNFLKSILSFLNISFMTTILKNS